MSLPRGAGLSPAQRPRQLPLQPRHKPLSTGRPPRQDPPLRGLNLCTVRRL